MSLFWRDIKLAMRSGGGALLGVLFFLAVISVVPFAVGPDLNFLQRIGPAMLWIGALLSTLLGLDRLFQAERDDGSLDIMLMQETPFIVTVFIKCVAHWVATGLPLVLATPLLGLLMNMDLLSIGAVSATLLVGSPAITFIGAVGAAVAVTLPRGGLLVSILILPLAIPVLIFGVSAAYAAVEDPAPFMPPFLILCAITMFFAVIGPLAAAAAIRASTD
jgi:heme exporter protein B